MGTIHTTNYYSRSNLENIKPWDTCTIGRGVNPAFQVPVYRVPDQAEH